MKLDSMAERPSGTLTMLHSDIENSTSLTRHLRDEYPAVLARHQSFLRAAFAANDGLEVDTQGDSFFAVFTRATQAVAASAALQRALAEESWPGEPLRVRVGLHTGEPILTAAGYTGLDVIRAARIKEAGHGGQVLLSASTAAIVEDVLVDDLSLRDRGAHRLKSLPRPERIFELLIAGLATEFPPLKTLDSPAEGRSGVEPTRVVTAVLFADIAGATERIVAVGDRRWREFLVRLRTAIRAELMRHGGYEVETAGDTILATFDAPTRAVRCGCAVLAAVKPLGIDVRVGIHAGEVEREGNDLFGITLHIGARIRSLAQPGEVLVSSAVRDMVVGSGIAFTDRGAHILKGIPGEWRLYAPALDSAALG